MNQDRPPPRLRISGVLSKRTKNRPAPRRTETGCHRQASDDVPVGNFQLPRQRQPLHGREAVRVFRTAAGTTAAPAGKSAALRRKPVTAATPVRTAAAGKQQRPRGGADVPPRNSETECQSSPMPVLLPNHRQYLHLRQRCAGPPYSAGTGTTGVPTTPDTITCICNSRNEADRCDIRSPSKLKKGNHSIRSIWIHDNLCPPNSIKIFFGSWQLAPRILSAPAQSSATAAIYIGAPATG